MEKIGVGIVTYNSENYYKDLYNSIDQTKIDPSVYAEVPAESKQFAEMFEKIELRIY